MASAEAIIKKVLEKEFENVEIVSIKVREASAFEEDDFLYVTVVFKSDGPLDSKATTGVVRHLRPKLHEIEEDRFPVISYVAGDEWEGRATA